MRKKSILIILILLILTGSIFAGYWAYRILVISGGRTARVIQFIREIDRTGFPIIDSGGSCVNSPFIFPTRGYIGFFWDDSFRPFHRHQGVDVFGGTDPGVVPVFAASDGFLTRQPDWKSSVIIRIPDDPIHPGQQVWLYYTHLAYLDGKSTIIDSFPPGSSEVPVKAGDLVGYQGNYSGDPLNPTGVHLHFSIVKDNGNGDYLNELKIKNTIDPTVYFGMRLNAAKADEEFGCYSETP